LKEIKRQCAIPPNIDIKVDPFFEKEFIDILIKVRDTEEFGEALKKLTDILNNGHIGRIFGLAKN